MGTARTVRATGARLTRAALALVAVVAWAGCSASAYRLDRGISRRLLSPGELDRHNALVTAGDAQWRQRATPGRVRQALASWTAAVAMADDDWLTYQKIARARFFLADQLGLQAMAGDYPFDGDHVVNRAAAAGYRRNHLLGFRAALRGMAARSREFEQRLAAGISLEASLPALRRDAAALVYWYVANLARWARAEGVGALIRNRSRIQASMTYLYRLDRRAVSGGADRLLGVYDAVVPDFAGGDLGRARAHFAAALRLAPDYLDNWVYAAQYLDTALKDRAQFLRHLHAALAAPVDPPNRDIGPENELARRKAQALLRRVDRYFPAAR